MKPTLVRTKGRILVTNRQGQSFLCAGRNRAWKAARKLRGTAVSGHPTKRHTPYRDGLYSQARAVKMAKARLRYENMLVALYGAAGCGLEF